MITPQALREVMLYSAKDGGWLIGMTALDRARLNLHQINESDRIE